MENNNMTTTTTKPKYKIYTCHKCGIQFSVGVVYDDDDNNDHSNNKDECFTCFKQSYKYWGKLDE